MENRIIGPGRPVRPRISGLAARRRPTAKRRTAIVRPLVESLEGRALLSTLTVTSADDDGPGSLRAEIAAAVPGDTIQFAPKLTNQTIHLTTGEFVIAHDLTIQGPGAEGLDVDAGGLSRVFRIDSADVTISGLTISGGRAPIGGGILDDGGALTLTDVTVAGNRAVGADATAAAQGGGVAIVGGSATITRSTFRGNSAQGAVGPDGGTGRYNGFGGEGDGGGVYFDGPTLAVSDSLFADNLARGGDGGNGGQGQGTSSSYAFNDPGGTGNGGGIYVRSGALTIAGGRFTANVARGGDGGAGAGGVYSINGRGGSGYGGAVSGADTVTNALFDLNQALGGDAAPGGYAGGASGGAVNGADSVSGSRFEGNAARAGAGPSGGWVQGAAIYGPSSVDHSSFVGNQAIGGDILGGTISSSNGGFYSPPPDMSVKDSSFSNNLAIGQSVGGGVLFGYRAEIDGSTFTGNQAIGSKGADAAPQPWLRSGGFVGGGVLWLEDEFSVSDSVFTANRAVGGAGGAGDPGDAGGGGGSVYGGVISTIGLFGGIAVGPDTHFLYSVSGSTFTGNEAIGGAGGTGGTGGGDGGRGGFVWGGDVLLPGWATLVGNTFTGTRATGGSGGRGADGGGAGGAGGEVLGGSVSLLDLFGSGFYYPIPVEVQGIQITGVSARGGDGGDGGSGGKGGDGGSVQGGGLDLGPNGPGFGSETLTIDATISDARITGNSARGGDGGRGGAGADGGDGGDVQGGGAYFGGSLFSYGDPPPVVIDVAITNAQFSGNGAIGGNGGRGGRGGAGGDASGGGLFANSWTTLHLDGVTITGNRARGGAGGKGPIAGAAGQGVGGGVYLGGTGSVRVRTKIQGNSASTDDDDVFGLFG